jgi:hypothetical protein
MIARCQTILGQRGSVVAPAAGPDGSIAADAAQPGKPGKPAKRRAKNRTKSGK